MLDGGLNTWNQVWGAQDKALAIDGKTMKNALDEEGHHAHILSAVGHEWKRSYAQKISTLPVAGSDEKKRTMKSGWRFRYLNLRDRQQ